MVDFRKIMQQHNNKNDPTRNISPLQITHFKIVTRKISECSAQTV